MNYSLKDLLDIPRLRELLDSLVEINSVPSAVIDTEGNVLTATASQEICTKFHRVNPVTGKKCLESDRNIEARLGEKPPHVIYRCPMGLVDAATPIIIDGKHLGNVFTGPLFIEQPDEAYFIKQARQYGFDESEYLAAMRKVPFITEEKLHKNLNFIGNLTQMMAEQGLQNKRQCKTDDLIRESEVALLTLMDTLKEKNKKLLATEESLREQNNELLATEEMLRVQIEEYEGSQKLLKESEERFKALSDASFGAVVIHDMGLILDCNQVAAEMSGYTIEELIGMDGLKLIAPDWLALVLQNMKSGFDQRYEVEGIRKDGKIFPMAIRGKAIPYKGLTVRVNEFRDITERKQAENELLRQKNLLSTILESTTEAIFAKDRDGKYISINEAGARIFGFRTADMIGHTDIELMSAETANEFGRQMREYIMSSGQTCKREEIGVIGGKTRILLAHKVPWQDSSGEIIGVIGVSNDITERKEHEKEQLKIENLESLGILAGGIAHDFNNILTGIMGNISFAQMFLDSSHMSYKPLEEAEKASVRATELAHQLLTFARGGEPVKKMVSLQHLANETVSMVLHGSNVKGAIDIPDSLHAIEADEGQMSQVFHNIIINAMQAMPEGGTLSVTAQNETLGENAPMPLPPGPYIRLTFTDQGCGISGDILKKIFDPYFTTKSDGNGLGLASANSIIKRHGGHIAVSSVVGKGTTFTILLPSTGEPCSKYQTVSDRQIAGDHTGGSILIMDDEEMIREMTTEMLKYLGYQVTACENGADTIMRYKTALESGTPFSAVILDLTIPGGMGGKETAQLIHAIDPKACLIVSSGYSNDPIMSDYGSFGFSGAVAKPYKMLELGQLLKSLLSTR